MKERKLLMIPGPIEFDDLVHEAMGEATISHVSPCFIDTFGHSLEMMRDVWESPAGQPFILAGSGTLAMDCAASNLIEEGDRVLVLSTGYFGERYAELVKRYGAEVEVISSGPGDTVPEEIIEAKLKEGGYKCITITHVDTSTAVRVNPRPIGELGRKYDVLTILDGVCSVAGEEIHQDNWGIDVVLTASQKAIGVPPGLALLVASEKAVSTWKNRKTRVRNYYADWGNWLPVMEAYEQRKPSYFGTPAVNLVAALEVSLKQILSEGSGVRVKRHKLVAESFRSALKALNIQQIPVRDQVAANTLSAPYYPEGVNGVELIGEINRAGVIVAGGLHKDLKSEYFRVGHMGTVSEHNHIIRTVAAIEEGLAKCSYGFRPGIAVEAAINTLNKGGIPIV